MLFILCNSAFSFSSASFVKYVIPLINPPLVYYKEKKYNAFGRRCIYAKIRNPIKKTILGTVKTG